MLNNLLDMIGIKKQKLGYEFICFLDRERDRRQKMMLKNYFYYIPDYIQAVAKLEIEMLNWKYGDQD